MVNVAFFVAAGALYFGATLAYRTAWVGKVRRFCEAATRLLLAAVAVHGLGILVRWLESGYPPLSNAFESLSFYAWSLAVAYLLWERKGGRPGLGALVTPIALGAIVVAAALPKRIRPLLPVLQSHWLGIHVTISFLAYAVFTLAFASAVAFLRQDYTLKRRKSLGWGQNLPSLVMLETLGWRCALVGFFLLTGSLVSGSIWAVRAWGVPWVWQPQQVATLVTWFVYAAYFLTRRQLRWRGRRSAWLLVAGFVAVVMTFVGVDLLLPGGYHSFLLGGD